MADNGSDEKWEVEEEEVAVNWVLEADPKPKETKDNSDLYPEMDYFMNESKSDVIFIIDGQRVPALRHVLMVGSVYFRAMFSGSFAESEKQEIEIKDTTYEAFKAVVWYLYTHELSFDAYKDLDCDLVADVCKLSDAYGLPRILPLIGQHLNKCLSVNNLVFISKIAFNYNMNELKASVKEFIDLSYETIIGKDMDYIKEINAFTDDYLLGKLVPKAVKLVTIKRNLCYNCKHFVDNDLPVIVNNFDDGWDW